MTVARHHASALLGAAAVLLTITGCSGGYDREELVSDFQEQSDLTEEQANCIADELEAQLDADSLANIGRSGYVPTQDEVATIAEASFTCIPVE